MAVSVWMQLLLCCASRGMTRMCLIVAMGITFVMSVAKRFQVAALLVTVGDVISRAAAHVWRQAYIVKVTLKIVFCVNSQNIGYESCK